MNTLEKQPEAQEQIFAAYSGDKTCKIVLDASPYHLSKVLSISMKKSPELRAAIFYALKDLLKDATVNGALEVHIKQALSEIPE